MSERFIVRNDFGPDYTFGGRLLAKLTSDENEDRCRVIWQADNGTYVCLDADWQLTNPANSMSRKIKHKAAYFTDLVSVYHFFGFCEEAKTLYRMAGIGCEENIDEVQKDDES